MNNYINTLKIAGSKQQIKEVREYLQGSGNAKYIDLNNVIKMPEDLKSKDEFQWAVKNWGTIWHKNFHQKLVDENVIEFLTRGGDTLYIVDVISKIFPNVGFQLEYWGESGISGEAYYNNGIVSDDYQWDTN